MQFSLLKKLCRGGKTFRLLAKNERINYIKCKNLPRVAKCDENGPWSAHEENSVSLGFFFFVFKIYQSNFRRKFLLFSHIFDMLISPKSR